MVCNRANYQQKFIDIIAKWQKKPSKKRNVITSSEQQSHPTTRRLVAPHQEETKNSDSGMLWIPLFDTIRQRFSATVVEEFHKNQIVWVIDEDVPQVFKARTVSQKHKKCEEKHVWTVEIDKKDRASINDDWRIDYPPWIMFSEEDMARKICRALLAEIDHN